MDRKTFLKQGLISGLFLGLSGQLRASAEEDLSKAELPQVGFEHLPAASGQLADYMVLHRADTRGSADHGWLRSKHSFSFASYQNRARMHFGVLRVLNDDEIAGGTGFGMHPHDNMEIISIPLQGGLEHQDSMGNNTVIRAGEVQVMSAGTGVKHSEYNHSKTDWGAFLQIWLFPKVRQVAPRYDQKAFAAAGRRNAWQNIVAPMGTQLEGVKVHQDAWFWLSDLTANKTLTYQTKQAENGLYLFLIEGSLQVGGQILNKRDALGVWNVSGLEIRALKESKVLLMDIPMQLPRI